MNEFKCVLCVFGVFVVLLCAVIIGGVEEVRKVLSTVREKDGMEWNICI